MIFKAQPNLYVKIANKFIRRSTGRKGFLFDDNGEYETLDPVLIRALRQHFEVKEEGPKEENNAVKHCKKCEFTCSTQGELLRHYKIEHPKEG